MSTTEDVQTEATESCEHHWEHHLHGRDLPSIAICTLCRTINWQDLQQQLAIRDETAAVRVEWTLRALLPSGARRYPYAEADQINLRKLLRHTQAAVHGTPDRDLPPGAAEQLARRFHELYEELQPAFGYRTREASAKPWYEVPQQNRDLMVTVCTAILGGAYGVPGQTSEELQEEDVHG
jgi:hypothetical protein